MPSANHDLDSLRKSVQRLRDIYWAVSLSQDDFWKAQFATLYEETEFVDPLKAERLKEEGLSALKREDMIHFEPSCGTSLACCQLGNKESSICVLTMLGFVRREGRESEFRATWCRRTYPGYVYHRAAPWQWCIR